MLVGHFAVGLLAKRAVPSVSVGTFALAAMLSDLLFFVFVIAGAEQARVARGGLIAQNIALSHGLVTNLLWGALLGAGFLLWRRYRPGAWALFAVVLSHWLLDFISHKPDMPLSPGTDLRLGLGLWNSIPATIVLEGGLWIAAVILYARAARPANWAGVVSFWSIVVVLTLAWINNIAGPPPASSSFAMQGLIFFSLVVAWFYLVNRLRPAVAPASRAPTGSGGRPFS
jgi:hypothetical protein